MAEFRVTVPAGDPLTVTAETAQVTDGVLLLGASSAGSTPRGLFAAGEWCSAVDTAALPADPPSDPVPDPDPPSDPTPDVPTPEPDPPTPEPE